MTVKVMFSFPDQLVARMRSAIPPRERSKVTALLLEKEIIRRERSLYQCAVELEGNKKLKEEITSWDVAFGGDGLEDV